MGVSVTSWLKSLLVCGSACGHKDHDRKNIIIGSTSTGGGEEEEEMERWSFNGGGRSMRSLGYEQVAVGRRSPWGAEEDHDHSSTTTWLRSFRAQQLIRDNNSSSIEEQEQSKHAIAVAAATAAAADAAVAAAHAAVAVVRLTSQGAAAAAAACRSGGEREWCAALKIQSAFRCHLSKRAVKAVVKLQALVRGYLVRKQTAALTFESMQAQATLRLQQQQQFIRRSLTPADDLIGGTPQDQIRNQMRPPPPDGQGHPRNRMILANLDDNNSSAADESSPTSKMDKTYFPCSNKTTTTCPPLQQQQLLYTPTRRLSMPNLRHHNDLFLLPRKSTSTAINNTIPPHYRHCPRHMIMTSVSVCTTTTTPAATARDVPNYMVSTQSFNAKLRSQSTPKQRRPTTQSVVVLAGLKKKAIPPPPPPPPPDEAREG